MNVFNQSCAVLPGVGPALAKKLSLCGIHTLQDLLFHLPYRYQDRTRITPIRDLRHQDWAVVVGKICKTEIKFAKKRILQCFIEDQTGLLRLRFFYFHPHQVQALAIGAQIKVFGEARLFEHHLDMIHPEYQIFETDQPCAVEENLTPIYATTHGLSQSRIRQLVALTLKKFQLELEHLEWMPAEELKAFQFQPLPSALQQLHTPPPDSPLHLLETGQHAALKRLAFDELLAQRVSMLFARQQRAHLCAEPMLENPVLIQQFLQTLPFPLTQAQQRVQAEIAQDLTKTSPMLRIVQGDVGSGKTVVAALAALQVISQGFQVALMAPTDILSEQHTHTLRAWFEPLGIPVHRLSSKMNATTRKKTLAALLQQQSVMIIGTHALFQEEVIFSRLGLIIIDEQHRFGVTQRMRLQQKGVQGYTSPHQLLMTATPIPRTLAMTQLAHLDLSVIDELPPGRTPITTVVLHHSKRDDMIVRLRNHLQNGRQAYWVCTLIEESEKLQCQAATETTAQLQLLLPELKIGLVHGRLASAAKEEIMQQFKTGSLQLLVATTVIEVGVDVPNASLMIIENSERLGLSQLHQLRGRIGRGNVQSHCVLLYQTPLSQVSRERLHWMKKTQDGFILAEQDLKLRGSGEILGTRQTGYRNFKIANPARDQALLEKLNHYAQQLMGRSPETAHVIAKRWLGDFEPLIIS